MHRHWEDKATWNHQEAQYLPVSSATSFTGKTTRRPSVWSGTHLPGVVGPRGISLIESGGAIKVETHNEGGDAKRPAPVALRIALGG